MDFNRCENIIVVEQDYGKYVRDISLHVLIALVYAFFFSVLIDRILGREEIEKNCALTDKNVVNTPEYKEKCKVMKKNYYHNKSNYLTIIGSLSIIYGMVLSITYDEYVNGGLGITLGGIITLLYRNYESSPDMRNDILIAALSILLSILLYTSKTLN